MRYFLHRLLFALLLMVFFSSVHAAPPQAADSTWRWTFQAAAVHQFEADLDKGGDVSVNRYFASLSATRQLSSRLNMGLDIGYGEDSYDFSGSSGFGALDAWGQIRELRISVPIRYFASREWALFALPSLRYQAEQGASLDDGQTGGLIAGAIYRFSDAFSIGPGLGVFSEIEDDTSVFPILLIDWKITDTLSLETGGGLAASRGPGLQLTWQPTSRSSGPRSSGTGSWRCRSTATNGARCRRRATSVRTSC